MANKKFTEVERFFLENNFGKRSVPDIAQSLGRTEKEVQKEIQGRGLEAQLIAKRVEDTKEFPNQDLSPVTNQPKTTNLNVKPFFGRRMKDGKPEGITVMTEAASQAADEVAGLNRQTSGRFNKCIYKRPDEQGSD